MPEFYVAEGISADRDYKNIYQYDKANYNIENLRRLIDINSSKSKCILHY